MHNMVVHPLLPFADVAEHYGGQRARRIAWLVYRAHDATVPEGAG